MDYQAKLPYPSPRVEAKNPYYAVLLLEDYAGTVSEETAIHLYLYQYLTQNQQYQEIAMALHHISEVEMHHLQLLGETISLLGVDPKYRTIDLKTRQEKYWNANFVTYEKNIVALLKTDIEKETAAINQYQQHRHLIRDIYIQNLLTRIIEDEQIHLQIFQYYLNKFTKKTRSNQ